jgi:hypothetical protein
MLESSLIRGMERATQQNKLGRWKRGKEETERWICLSPRGEGPKMEELEAKATKVQREVD